MKKTLIAFWAVSLTACLALSSCHEKEQPETNSGFSLGRNLVEIPAHGGEASIPYIIQHPTDGAIVELTDIPDWLMDIHVETETETSGTIKFNVDSTVLEEPREAEITAAYGDISQTFKVIQTGNDPKIFFEIHSVCPTSVRVKAVPKDENMDFYVNVIEKSIWDSYKSSEDVFAADMETFKLYAEMSNMTVEQWMQISFEMSQILSDYILLNSVATSDGEGGARAVTPETEYVTYCYGINGKGEILTNLYSIETSTTAFDFSNPTTYDIQYQMDGTKFTGAFIPSDKNQHYNAGIKMYPKGIIPDKEDLILELHRGYELRMFMAFSHPDNTTPYEDIVNSGSAVGDTHFDNLDTKVAGKPGILFAYSIDEMGNISGDLYYECFNTPEEPKSDNVITMSISDLTPRSAILHVNTTNNDPYIVVFAKYDAAYDGLSGIDLLSAIGSNSTILDGSGFASGNKDFELSNLSRDTKYIAAAYGYNNASYTTDVVTFEFTTPSQEIVEVSCIPAFEKYFNTTDLYETWPENFPGYDVPGKQDVAFVPVTVQLEGNPDWYSYAMYSASAVNNWDDDQVITVLENVNRDNSLGMSKNFEMIFDNPLVLIAVARDKDGKYGEVYRSEEFTLTRENCSPATEYVPE